MAEEETAFGAEDFAAVLGVSRETRARLELYAELLQRWNRRINLVGRQSLEDSWRRHFLDSAQLIELLPPPPAGRALTIADMGSGAGFPGMVLSLMGAGEVHLIEADRRKCAFLQEVARQTGAPVQIHSQRLEHLEALQVDVVTARALAPLDRLLEYAQPLLRPNGFCLFLKGRNFEEELDRLNPDPEWKIRRHASRTAEDSVILEIGFKG